MLHRVKISDENMFTYYQEKLALINACGIEGTRVVNLLLGGLKTTTIQAVARPGDHQTPVSLLRFPQNVGKFCAWFLKKYNNIFIAEAIIDSNTNYKDKLYLIVKEVKQISNNTAAIIEIGKIN